MKGDIVKVTCQDCDMFHAKPSKKHPTVCPDAGPNDSVCAAFEPKETEKKES